MVSCYRVALLKATLFFFQSPFTPLLVLLNWLLPYQTTCCAHDRQHAGATSSSTVAPLQQLGACCSTDPTWHRLEEAPPVLGIGQFCASSGMQPFLWVNRQQSRVGEKSAIGQGFSYLLYFKIFQYLDEGTLKQIS